MRRFAVPLLALVLLAGGLLLAPPRLTSRTATSHDFTHWESGHVRPAVLTPDGTRLLVVNTPDNRLTVFDLSGAAPARVAEIPVGLEPVAVSCLDDGTAWVVNQLSDDVSVVDLNTLHVRATLRVGDEPSDVVFAGTPVRAYVSVSQEDRVRVYQPNDLGAAPVDVAIPGRMPRALARSADGAFVYAAVFHAGNRTSIVPFADIPVGGMPVDTEFPRSPSLPPTPPRVGLIVQRQDAQWKDMYGGDWTVKLPYDVPDVDVARIATGTNAVTTFGGVGAVNFGIAVSPADGRVAITSTEARNLLRFEPRLRGHAVDTQLGTITAGGVVSTRNLNPHVNYGVTPGPASERDSAVGIPTGVAFAPDGQRVYVSALGSDRLAVLDPHGTGVLARVPTVAGPTGVVVDAVRGRIYVVGRFRNQLQTLSAATLAPLAVTGIGFDPTPDEIVNGRKFFYGGFTSGHGEQACASCHVFGDFDNLAWDLGDPAGTYQAPPKMIDPFLEGFDPMKGPMTTQSLRGLPGTGLLHWRGDRADLSAFNDAFVGLMGRSSTLPDSEMTAFNDFTLALAYPPNPYQHLNRTMPNPPTGPSALRGQNLFMNQPIDGGLRCNDCHRASTGGTNGQIINDAALQEDQDVKVPQLRNMYKKTGFSRAATPGNPNKRGFGFLHDGSIDNLFEFLKFSGFSFSGGATGDAQRRDVEAFMHAFDTGLAPAVGRRITFDGSNHTPLALARLDTLRGQAAAAPANCDLIAKGRVGGAPRGWRYQAGPASWRPDRSSEPDLTTPQLLALAGAGAEITVTGVPAGNGDRMGIDRDRDGFVDTDETDAGSDPSNPASTPFNVSVPGAGGAGFALRAIGPNPFRDATEVRFALGRAGPVDATVYDVLGREVRAIARGVRLDAGSHSLRWDGRDASGSPAPAGVYFVRLATEGGRWTRPVVRLR